MAGATPRILVCIGEDSSAHALARTAVQLAREHCAELYALHIESPGAATRRTPQTSAQLARNLRHAADLGAQAEVRADHRVADAILKFVREHGITCVVVGPTRRTGWRRVLGADIPGRLRAAGVAAVVVAGE
ncbi:MAG: hypothetical protein RLZZ387_1769 [Chloroflexota bacterium]